MRFWRWLAEAQVAIMCILIIVAAGAQVLGIWRSEDGIRIIGYILQVLGMVFAVRGLLSIRRHFGQQSLSILTIDWLKRFPKWRRNQTIEASAHMISVSGMNARAEVWTRDDPSLPVDQRIERILRNLERLREGQASQAHAIDELTSRHDEHAREVAAAQTDLEHQFRTDLELLHTSDLFVSLAGLVWLTVGFSMSTLAGEVYAWLP